MIRKGGIEIVGEVQNPIFQSYQLILNRKMKWKRGVLLLGHRLNGKWKKEEYKLDLLRLKESVENGVHKVTKGMKRSVSLYDQK